MSRYYFKVAALIFFVGDLVSTIIGQPSQTTLTWGLIFIMLDAIRNVKEN